MILTSLPFGNERFIAKRATRLSDYATGEGISEADERRSMFFENVEIFHRFRGLVIAVFSLVGLESLIRLLD